ncbi:DUF3150 domain-containing protein [Comamonas thiooxydans]|nr:DUF3150 domain-containing protein [Comamonas thiooxydans]KGH27167.1 hypothetical protein P607_03950 [Comamonas thiooxydans]
MTQTNSNKINHLTQLCVVHADFDIWSGQVRLTADDLKLGAGGEIPPEKIAQLGTKKICDPAQLKGFHRVKAETRRTLLRIGMKFMDGVAIPLSKMDEVCKKMGEVQTEFDALRTTFIANYNAAIDSWCKENPQYETAIRSGALPQSVVEKRLGFDFQIFKIAPTDDAELSTRLEEKVHGLGDDLINELIEEADKFYEDRLLGRDKCGIGTKQTLQNLRDKLDGLSFLNSKIKPLVDLLNETLNGYKTYAVGRDVTGPFFHQLTATMLILSSKARIEQYLNGAISVKAEAATLEASASQNQSYASASSTAEMQPQSAEGDLFTSVDSAPAPAQASSNPADAFIADLDRFFGTHARTETSIQPQAAEVVHRVDVEVLEAPAGTVSEASEPAQGSVVIDVEATFVPTDSVTQAQTEGQQAVVVGVEEEQAEVEAGNSNNDASFQLATIGDDDEDGFF